MGLTQRVVLQGTYTMRQVGELRRFIERVHSSTLDDGDMLSRLAMATHELCENAIKFAVDGQIDLQVAVEEAAQGLLLQVRTRNRAAAKDRAALEAIVRGIATSSDVSSYYLELMMSSPDTTGGLGLLRIAAEGEMQLRIHIDGETVAIDAELHA